MIEPTLFFILSSLAEQKAWRTARRVRCSHANGRIRCSSNALVMSWLHVTHMHQRCGLISYFTCNLIPHTECGIHYSELNSPNKRALCAAGFVVAWAELLTVSVWSLSPPVRCVYTGDGRPPGEEALMCQVTIKGPVSCLSLRVHMASSL